MIAKLIPCLILDAMNALGPRLTSVPVADGVQTEIGGLAASSVNRLALLATHSLS